jgi:hypothetical protein
MNARICTRCGRLIWAERCGCQPFKVRYLVDDDPRATAEIIHAYRPEQAAERFLQAAGGNPDDADAAVVPVVVDGEPYHVRITRPPLYQAARVEPKAPA